MYSKFIVMRASRRAYIHNVYIWKCVYFNRKKLLGGTTSFSNTSSKVFSAKETIVPPSGGPKAKNLVM